MSIQGFYPGLLLALIASLFSTATYADSRIAVGGGLRLQSSLYQGVDQQSQVLPDFDLRSKHFFIKGIELGVYVLPQDKKQQKSQRRGFDITVGLDKDQLNGKRENSDSFSNLKDVDSGVNLKLGWQQQLGASHKLEVHLLQDIADQHQGQQASIGWKYAHRFNSTGLIISPAIERQWFSKELSQHYFTSNQVADPGFRAKDFQATTLTLSLAYPINRNWLVNGKFELRHFDNQLKRSALIERNQTQSLYLGVRYYW